MALFEEQNPDLYGTYSDYHPEEIIKQTEIKELELEIAELRTEVTQLKQCLGVLKRAVLDW